MATDYRVDIYRIGYYGGMGARKITTINPSAPLPQNQPVCVRDAGTKLLDCGNWAVSASWAVLTTMVSGVYIANLIREDGTTGVSQMIFVVRDDEGGSDLLLQTSDATWQASTSMEAAAFTPPTTVDEPTRSATTDRSPRAASAAAKVRRKAGSSIPNIR
ncbi:N,N-dimethylformamidase beta subunit family domain-containing protein [Streptosporangium lutulentum]